MKENSVVDNCFIRWTMIISFFKQTKKIPIQYGIHWSLCVVNCPGKIKNNTFNPDFGHISQIHSHRAEIYGVLSVLTFIKEYSNYFMIPSLSEIAYYCDNLEVVHKINTLATNPNSFNELHKTTDHDAVLQLKLCFPSNIIAFHVKGHQDTRKKWEHLTIPERLNIQADKLIG